MYTCKIYHVSSHPARQRSNLNLEYFQIRKYMGFDYLQITMHPAKLQGSGETVQSWSQIVIWKVISRFVNGQGLNLCTLKLQDLGRPRVALSSAQDY